jgi:hypothetical protein
MFPKNLANLVNSFSKIYNLTPFHALLFGQVKNFCSQKMLMVVQNLENYYYYYITKTPTN